MQPFRASPLGGGAGGGSGNVYYYSPKSATQQQPLPVTMVVSSASGANNRINYNQQGSATVIQQPPIFQRQQRSTYHQPVSPMAQSQMYAASPAQHMLAESAPRMGVQSYSTGPTLYQTATISNKLPAQSLLQQPGQQVYQQSGNRAQIVPSIANIQSSPSPTPQAYSYAVQKQFTSPSHLTAAQPPQQYAMMSAAPTLQYMSAPSNTLGLVSSPAMAVRPVPGQVMPMVFNQNGDVTSLAQMPTLPQTMISQPQMTISSPSTPPLGAMSNQSSIMPAPIYSNQFLTQMAMPQMSVPAQNIVYTTGEVDSIIPASLVQEMTAYEIVARPQPRYVQEAPVRPPAVASTNSGAVAAPLEITAPAEEPAQPAHPAPPDVDSSRYDWGPFPAVTPATTTATVQEAIIPQTSAVSRQTPIEAGSIMPSAHIDLHGVCVNLQEFFEDRSGVLFGVLGAFNPHDTKTTVPLILSNMPSFERLVDFVGCLLVNDPFVIKAWAKKLGVSDQFTFIADSDARFTEALGVGINLPEKGLGLRCRRFAAVVGPRAIFRYVALDEDARADRVLAVLPRFVRTPWKSFLIGISYEDDGVSGKAKSGGSFSTVYQSINDMRNYLADYGFCSESDWQLILSNCLDDVFKPTAENIMSGLKWLVDGAQAGDVLCCYFNGQTVKRIDPNTDEEILCIKAIDHLDGGLVNLADVASVLLPAVPENCRLNMIIDGACMSLDLNYCNGECVRESSSNPNHSRASRRSNDPNQSYPEGEIFVLEAKKYGAAQALMRLPKFSTYRAVARELSETNVSANGDTAGAEPVINFWSSRPINLDQELHISDVLDPTEFTAQTHSPSPGA